LAEPNASGSREARQRAYALRAGTRRISPSERERACGIWCVEHTESHPSIQVRRDKGERRASYRGILTCGHIWSCPACSHQLRTERAGRIVRAVGHLGGRWQMVTVTLRHRQGMRLKELRDAMAAAWRRTRQGGRIQRVWADRVSASVRAQEVTFGANGWHPHIHVLLRTTEWDEDERDALQARWERAIVDSLGEHVRPDDLHGIVWSSPFDASRDSGHRATYLAKLGLEAAGIAKEGRGSSRTAWELAEDATHGDDHARTLWWEYIEATRGKRMIELDDRAQAAAKRALELESVDAEDGGEPKPVEEIELPRDDVRALRRLERRLPTIMALVLRAAEERGAAGVAEWVGFARERLRASLERATSPPYTGVHHAPC
jgi:hypothetical protein